MQILAIILGLVVLTTLTFLVIAATKPSRSPHGTQLTSVSCLTQSFRCSTTSANGATGRPMGAKTPT